jgi:hypothetical protein
VQLANSRPFVQHATRNGAYWRVQATTRSAPDLHRHQGIPPLELGHQNWPWRASQAGNSEAGPGPSSAFAG